MRSNDSPTVPSTIEQELKTNLFMRCRDPEVLNILKAISPENAMKILREGKNVFK